MQRVALYVRVSTEEQAVHGLSVEAQTEALDSWAKEHKFKVVDHYIDAGISARKKATKRPNLQRLLDDVRSGNIDLIVFTKLDRWFRNIAEYYKVQEVLEKYKVNWRTIHEDYDTSTASGRLKINIMLSVAQDEADRTSERIKVVLDSKKQRNEVCTGHLPKGYKIEGKHAVKDPDAAPKIEAFFREFLQTGSTSAAIKAVPEWNLHYRTASKMLDNTGYYGEWHGLTLPSYITKQEFDRIQQLRRRLPRKTKQNRLYLFSGLLTCADCGRRMGGRPRKVKNGEHYVYSCDGYYQYKGCPNNANIMEGAIEEYLLTHIDREIELIESTKPTRKKDNSAQVAAVKKKLSKLSELYVNDMISMDDYKRQYDSLNDELSSIVVENVPEIDISAIRSSFCGGWVEIYKKLNKENKRAFWHMKIKEIRVDSERNISFDFL